MRVICLGLESQVVRQVRTRRTGEDAEDAHHAIQKLLLDANAET